MFRRSVCLVAALCVVAAGLVIALPDDTPTADAHPPAPEEYTYYADVEKTREVDVYDWVEIPVYGYVDEDVYGFVPKEVQVNKTRKVPVFTYITGRQRVAPFRESYTYKPPCTTVIINGQAGTYCPPSETRYREVFNYKRVTRRVQTGTRTETYTVTETQMVWEKTGTKRVRKQTGVERVWQKTGTRTETYTVKEERTGTRMVHGPHGRPLPTAQPTATATPDPTTTPTEKPDDDSDDDSETAPTKPEINIPPEGVTCPAGYEYGTGSLGSSQPRTAPSGKFWSSVKASFPVFPVHTCWQLRAASCPAGTIMAMARYSTTPNRLLIGYEEGHLPEAPDGMMWTHAVANADYACYKAVEKTGGIDLGRIIINGFEYTIRGGKVLIEGAEYVVEGGKIVIDTISRIPSFVARELRKAGIEALNGVSDFAREVICGSENGRAYATLVVSVALGAAATLFVTIVTANPIIGAGTGIFIAFGSGSLAYHWIREACNYITGWWNLTRPRQPSGASSNSPDNPPKPEQPTGDPDNPPKPTPAPTATPAPTPTPAPAPALGTKAALDAAIARMRSGQGTYAEVIAAKKAWQCAQSGANCG